MSTTASPLPTTAVPATVVHAPLPAVRLADVRLATGVRLRVTEHGDPAGRPVVLLHGFSDSWFSFSPLLPLLPAGLRAIVPDLRGHGASDRPADGYAPRDLAADVLALLDALGVARAAVVGHSMGSLVAQQVALAAPARVARLALVGSTARPDASPTIRELDAAIHALPDPVPTTFVREFQESTVHRALPEAFLTRVVAESLLLPTHVWRAGIAGMRATRAATALAGDRIPTLLLWGEHDAVFSRAEQDALLAMLPTARLHALAGVGHAPHWECPEEVARALTAFLGGRADQP